MTVISSNFIALMLILEYGNEYSCHSKIFTIKKNFSISKEDAFFEASKKMMLTYFVYSFNNNLCFFIFNFSGIKPIIDFGWMMTLGFNSFNSW